MRRLVPDNAAAARHRDFLDLMADVTARQLNASADLAEWWGDSMDPWFGPPLKLPRVTAAQVKKHIVEGLEDAERRGYIDRSVIESVQVERDPSDPRKFSTSMVLPRFKGLAGQITFKT